MTAPDRIELLQMLLDQMELDLRDDAPPQPPPPISLEFARQLSRSYLWPLSGDRPLADLFQDAHELTATIVRQDDRAETPHDEPISVIVRKAEDGETIELTSADWPEGWQPLAVVIGHFDDGATFEPAGWQDLLERFADRGFAGNEQCLSVAAYDERDFGDGQDTMSAALTPLPFSSSDLSCYYHRWEALLEVSARLPPGRAGGRAVAELTYADSGGRIAVQRRLVDLQIRDGEHWKGSARFRPPDEAREFRLLVRPYKASDLDLLPSAGVRELLADAEFASMRLQHSAEGLSFRPILPHQREMLANPDARWCLRVARVGREGDDDV